MFTLVKTNRFATHNLLSYECYELKLDEVKLTTVLFNKAAGKVIINRLERINLLLLEQVVECINHEFGEQILRAKR